MKKTYKISGMTCSGCLRTVETILKNQVGVEEVAVQLEPGQAEITFNETTTNAEKLAEVLGKMGYTMDVL